MKICELYEAENSKDLSGPYKIKDRVKVKNKKGHAKEHEGKTGTIVKITPNAYAIKFDDEEDVHKWYSADELSKIQD